MKIRHFCVGDVATNCYIVYDENTLEGAIIDPGDSADKLLAEIRRLNIELRYILLTHAHFDHVLAVGAIKRETGVPVVVSREDEYLFDAKTSLSPFGFYGRELMGRFDFPGADIFAGEGTEVTFGGMTAHYMSTPGHTPGSCVIQIGDTLFTGDTLFRGSCGRVDLPGGDAEAMLRSLGRLAKLEGDFRVLPGHDAPSTLDWERHFNPYMKQAMQS